NNNYDLLFFSDKGQVYKAKVNDFEDTKASVLGDYIPAKLGFDQGESVVFMVATKDYSGNLLFFFENGKCAKIPLSSYETKTNRKKLSGAYNTNSPLVKIEHICVENLPQINEKEEGQQVVIPQLDFDREFMLSSSQGKVLVVHSGMIALKTTRSSQGVNVLTLKKGAILKNVEVYIQGTLEKEHLHKTKNIPAAGKMPTFSGEQITLV
ncbi:MAG: DNA gyrase C-terminal beta-propeller domain-containing protein, partial [Clostridia bacterium]